ncbi:carboxypeptidase-like regulatory domain-containing protein [Flavobacterium magnesitis]|uniref:TonB-dependent receptor n=1 Tax=Flavobacterium magnesitis TaxID=3138077 RepID=UPI00358E1564
MKVNKSIAALFLLLVIFFDAKAQNKAAFENLKTVLKKIEKQHQVHFSYLEKDVAGVSVQSPAKEKTIESKIDFLIQETELNFEFITSNYIAISHKSKTTTIRFQLKDATNTIPIEAATIKINGSKNVTTSDAKGLFEIDPKTVFQIEISHINYLSKGITINTNETAKPLNIIYLYPLVNELKEVVTANILTNGISKKTDGSLEIKPKKFGLLPGLVEPDVFETLKQIPGIVSADETLSNLNVRGGTHDQNLFLWNGIRLFQTAHFFGLISALNPNLAHNIKIFKNGSSAFYGEGISSVVDIATQNRDSEKDPTSIGANLISADFFTQIKIAPQTAVEISARRSHTDAFQSPTYKSYYKKIFQNTAISNVTNNEIVDYNNKENFYFYDATAQITQKINSKTQANLSLIAISNSLELNEFKTENDILVTKNSSLKQATYAGALSVNSYWNSNFRTELEAYASVYNINSTNESITNNRNLNQENTIVDTGIRIKNYNTISNTLKFQSGYQFNEIGIRNFDQINIPAFFRSVKEVLISHALIGELSYQSNNNKIKTTLGVRNNYMASLSKNSVEPRLQFHYNFSDSFSTEIQGERKSQLNSQVIDLQQDFLGIEKRRWVLANDADIPVMFSNQWSVGFTFKKNQWLVILDNFYKQVSGITSKSQGFQNQLEFLRINGNYTVLGTELLVQKRIHHFTTWMSYSVLRNDYEFESFNPSIFPSNFEINHNLTTALIYDYNQMKLALGSTFFSGKPNTLPLSTTAIFPTLDKPEIAYDLPNSSNLTNYFQINVSGSKSFKFNKNNVLTVGVSVQNIFDTKNNINQNFRINNNLNTIEKVDTYSLSRTFNAFLRCSL